MVGRLIEAEYRKVSAAQEQIDQRSARLLRDLAALLAAPAFCWRWSSRW